VVTLIGMDRVNGLSLAYMEGGEGSVQVVKNGSTYTGSGTINGADSDNPTGPLTKSIEITVECP
jgi:hypothetical protein